MLPPAFISKEDIDHMIEALRNLCVIIEHRDFYKLIEHFLPPHEQNLRPLQKFQPEQIPTEITDVSLENVGFITHYINEDGARRGDESIALLSDDSINRLLEMAIDISSPILLNAITVQGDSGKKINVYFAGLLFTSTMAKRMHDKNLQDEYVVLVNKAADFLNKDFGCKTVGLGQYTSIISKNGQALNHSNFYITTGNSFTVGIGVQAIAKELVDKINAKAPLSVAVLGAAGNICSTYTKCLLPYFSTFYLKGSDTESGGAKTERFANELLAYIFELMLYQKEELDTLLHPLLFKALHKSFLFQKIKEGLFALNSRNLFTMLSNEFGKEAPIAILSDLDALRFCDATVVATNDTEPFLYSKYFKDDALVYDISVPANCTYELINNTRNIQVLMGGIVQLPNNEHIQINGFPLTRGEAYACISETMLLGLEAYEGDFSFGNLSPKQVRKINAIALKHGFTLKKPKFEMIF